MNVYQQQFVLLCFALKETGLQRLGRRDVAGDFFRRYHGLGEHVEAWSVFNDAQLLRLACELWHPRPGSTGARMLWRMMCTEVSRRGLMPRSADELSVALDAGQAAGAFVFDPKDPPGLFVAWARCRYLVRARVA